MTEPVVSMVELYPFRWVYREPSYLVMQRSRGEPYEQVWQGVTGAVDALLRHKKGQVSTTKISR